MKSTLPSFRSPTGRQAALVLAGCLARPCHAQSAALIDQARTRSALLRPELQDDDDDDETIGSDGSVVKTPGDLDLGVQQIMTPKERDHLLRLLWGLTHPRRV